MPSISDPFEEGHAAWTEKVQEIAASWFKGLGLMLVDIDIGKVLEYDVLQQLNMIYERAGNE